MKYKKICAILAIIFFLNCTTFSNALSLENKSVIFVLDSSGSMATNDFNKLAINYIEEFVHTLPSYYNVGVIAYNTGISLNSGLVSYENKKDIINQLKNISYQGYSNAGLGLSNAVELLNNNSSTKEIILLSDGEILMDNINSTQLSKDLFKESVELAEKNDICINVIGLAYDMEDDDIIKSSSYLTNGQYYFTDNASELSSIFNSILYDEMNIKKNVLAVADANGENQTINITLPSNKMSKATIFITSNNPITSLVADVTADNCIQFSGSHYSTLQLINPTSTELKVTLATKKDSQIKVEIVPELVLTPIFNQNENIISFSFVDKFNSKILTESLFENLPITISVQDELFDLHLNNGIISFDNNDFNIGIGSQEVKFDFSKLPINILYEKNLLVDIEPHVIETSVSATLPNFFSIDEIILGLFLLITLFILIYIFRKKQKNIEEIIPKIEENLPKLEIKSKYSYVGKLDIYITKNKSGLDIPPISFNLFRITNGRKLSLYEILIELEVTEVFKGSEKIYINPIANRSISITNISDSTIIRNNQILLRNKSHEITLNSKVDIIFEDEACELVIQYKNI